MSIPLNLIGFVVLALAGGCANAPSAAPAKTPPLLTTPPPFRLLLLGDTACGESYQARRSEKGEENILQTRGYDDAFALLAPLIASPASSLQDRADRVVANLETPVAGNVTDLPGPLAGRKQYLHWADVERTPAALAAAGIDTVSLANNHAMDQGAVGLRATLEALRTAGIEAFGAGLDEDAALQPVVIPLRAGGASASGEASTSGGPVVIAAGYQYRRNYDEDFEFYASGAKPGVNNWRVNRAAAHIAAVRRHHPRALLIAYPHWGTNYRWKTDEQVAMAHAMIDAGADLIVGHGSHALQEIERYNGRWIVYGLGNFVFNSPGRYEAEGCPPFSAAAMLEVTRAGGDEGGTGGANGGWTCSLRVYPIFSDNRITDYHPRPVTSEEFAEIQRRLDSRSPTPGVVRAGDRIDAGEDEIGHYLEVEFEHRR